MNLRSPPSWPSLAAAILLLLLAASGPVAADEPQACLGPAVGKVLQGMVEAHAFAGVVPSGYKLERLDVNKDHLEIGYEDDAGPAATVMLTPPGSGSAATPADARGPHFEHRLVELRGRPSGPARAAMLSAALLVDKAIPADELAACGASTDPRASKPNKHIVTMGAAALMVLAAIAFLIGRRRRPAPGGGEAPPPATP